VRTFGTQGADGTYQVPARWQAGLSNGANVGAIIGLIVSDCAAHSKDADKYTRAVAEWGESP
jgi:hypothetical protein